MNNSTAMKRYLETFLRYWFLISLPVVVLPVTVFALFGHGARMYAVTTNVYANPTSVQAYIYQDQYSTPAQNVANHLSQLVQLSSFDQEVVNRARPPKGYSREASLAQVASVRATPAGSNVVNISYLSSDPSFGTRVVKSFLAVASQETLAFDRKQNVKNVAALASALRAAGAQLKTASNNLKSYTTSHGIAPTDLVSASQADPTLGTLFQQVQNDQTQYQSAREQLTAAGVQQETYKSAAILDIFQNVDPVTVYPQSYRKTEIKNVAIALLLGLLLGGAFLVLKTAMDRSLRSADEVPQLLGLPVLVNIPYALPGSGRATMSGSRPRLQEEG